jgi:DNA-binding response OmpR family regulator
VLKDIPVVFLTAAISNQKTDGHEMVSGPAVYLAKPVDMGELTTCIERHVRKPSL